MVERKDPELFSKIWGSLGSPAAEVADPNVAVNLDPVVPLKQPLGQVVQVPSLFGAAPQVALVALLRS